MTRLHCTVPVVQIIRAVLASGSAMSYADVIEPGCIITHVNGRDAASFDSVLEALRHSALPLQLTLCNPFAIGSQH